MTPAHRGIVTDTSRHADTEDCDQDGQQARSLDHLAPSSPSCQTAGSQQVAAGDDIDLPAIWRGRRATAADHHIAMWCVALAVIGLIGVIVLGLTGASATAIESASAIATTALVVATTYLRIRRR